MERSENLSDAIYVKDCLKGLKEIHDEVIDCCVTSPPYYGLKLDKYGKEIRLLVSDVGKRKRATRSFIFII